MSAANARIAIACVVAALVLAGCETEQLPPGATLRIAPESRMTLVEDRSDADGNCTYSAGNYLDTPVVLSLTDAQGSPIGDAEVTVYADWSGQTFPGRAALALYDDETGNGNGVIDGGAELITGSDDDVAVVRTDEYGGDRTLLLRTNLSCPFRGDVFAFAGSAVASLSVEVAYETEEPPAPVDETDDGTDDEEEDGDPNGEEDGTETNS